MCLAPQTLAYREASYAWTRFAPTEVEKCLKDANHDLRRLLVVAASLLEDALRDDEADGAARAADADAEVLRGPRDRSL